MTRAVVAAALAFLLLPSPASSQDAPPPGTVDVIDLWNIVRHKPPAAADADADDYRRPMKAWAPVIGAKPSAGLMAGIAGNVAFFRGEPATTHISSLVTSLTFSTKKQTSLTGRFMLFTRDDRWRVEGDNRAQWTSQDTFGLGTSADADAAVNGAFDFFRIHETGYWQLRRGLFAGLGFHFDQHSNVRPGEDVDSAAWNNASFVEYSESHGLPLDRQISSGLSANLLHDSRDSTIDPRKGWLTAVAYRGLIDGFLGGSSGWELFHADGRAYVSLSPDDRHRLALWVFGDFVFGGTAPYFDLPATGMDAYGRSGRGYAEGRFRGERLVYGELEYRAALTRNGLLGMVAFLNATTVTNLQDDEHLFDSGAVGAGAGLRVLINKRSRTNLCFDVGIGKDGSHGVYLAVQEAF